MPAIRVDNLGIKFRLHHRKAATLKETVVNLFAGNNKKRQEDEDIWALRGVSFQVQEGECFGVIGKNGAGKSTLLQALTGIYRPDEGAVRARGSIGLLQLGTGFHPELSGRDNVYLNGAIMGLRKKDIDKVYGSIVEFSELERFMDMPLKNYSSGMSARLAFSIAINIIPDVLLIDEVLSVGDEGFRKKSRKRLDEIRGMGKTIMLVSHSLEDVANICKSAVCLDEGRVVFEGKSADAVSYYRDMLSRKEAEK